MMPQVVSLRPTGTAASAVNASSGNAVLERVRDVEGDEQRRLAARQPSAERVGDGEVGVGRDRRNDRRPTPSVRRCRRRAQPRWSARGSRCCPRAVAAEVAGVKVLGEHRRPGQPERPLSRFVVDLTELEFTAGREPAADPEHEVAVTALVRQRHHRPHDAADLDLRALEGVKVVGRQPDPRIVGVEAAAVRRVRRRQLLLEEDARAHSQLVLRPQVVAGTGEDRERRVRIAVAADVEATAADVGRRFDAGSRELRVAARGLWSRLRCESRPSSAQTSGPMHTSARPATDSPRPNTRGSLARMILHPTDRKAAFTGYLGLREPEVGVHASIAAGGGCLEQSVRCIHALHGHRRRPPQLCQGRVRAAFFVPSSENLKSSPVGGSISIAAGSTFIAASA